MNKLYKLLLFTFFVNPFYGCSFLFGKETTELGVTQESEKEKFFRSYKENNEDYSNLFFIYHLNEEEAKKKNANIIEFYNEMVLLCSETEFDYVLIVMPDNQIYEFDHQVARHQLPFSRLHRFIEDHPVCYRLNCE